MSVKMVKVIMLLLGFNLTLSALVLHNYCEDKGQVIKKEAGIYNEDYLFLGNELQFSGEAEDLVFLGKGLTFSGKTQLGLIALCEKMIYSGTSENGIIAGGMDILVDGSVHGTNYFGCKSFHLSEAGTIDGDIFAGCAKLLINGTINGNLHVAAGEIIINNAINGNVTAYGGRITIGANGKINGNLTYATKEKLGSEDLAKVSGVIKFDEKHKGDMEDWDSFAKFMKSFGFLIGAFLFLSFVVDGLLLLFLPVYKKLDGQQSEKTFWKTALWGLIPVLMIPAIIILSFALVITIPFAFVFMFACIPLFYIANITGTTLVGKYLCMKFKWNVNKRHYQFLIGIVASILLLAIPIVNCLVFLFVSSLGWGTFVTFLFNKDLTKDEKVSGTSVE